MVQGGKILAIRYHRRPVRVELGKADRMSPMKSLPSHTHVETLSVLIRGKVQGVGFRAATVRQAHQLKLGGWVRNLDDGRVEALLQGDHEALDRMLSWLWQGPPAARVDEVLHDEIQVQRFYDRFEQI